MSKQLNEVDLVAKIGNSTNNMWVKWRNENYRSLFNFFLVFHLFLYSSIRAWCSHDRNWWVNIDWLIVIVEWRERAVCAREMAVIKTAERERNWIKKIKTNNFQLHNPIQLMIFHSNRITTTLLRHLSRVDYSTADRSSGDVRRWWLDFGGAEMQCNWSSWWSHIYQ